MKQKITIRDSLALSDIPFLSDYEEVKKRLSIRLWNEQLLLRDNPEAVYERFLEFAVTIHIDVSDVVVKNATCMIKKGLPEYMGVEVEELIRDAIKNSTRIRPAVTTPIEMFVSGEQREGQNNRLMIASVNDFMYGAGVIIYPGFMNFISKGKNLFLIPSSIHEWLYMEDRNDFTGEQLTDCLRIVNREIVREEEILSDKLYYYDAGTEEIREA